MTKARQVGQAEVNQNRNRFIDIIPYDDNYVSLASDQVTYITTVLNSV